MRGDDMGREDPAGLRDRAVWQHSRMIEVSDEDAARALDLAGFADERLDLDDQERVAEWLAGDGLAAGDVAAARALAAQADRLEAAPEPVIARACALVGSDVDGGFVVGGRPAESGALERGRVISFSAGRAGRRDRKLLRMAGWGSLAAAMALAGWLGFTLGMDTTLSVAQFGQGSAQFGQGGDDGFLRELLDPSTGFMRELTEGAQT